MNFEEITLKVAQQKFPICVDTTFETVFVEYAKALREEWAKSLEPVATVAEIHMTRYTVEWINGPQPEGTLLYTLEDRPQ